MNCGPGSAEGQAEVGEGHGTNGTPKNPCDIVGQFSIQVDGDECRLVEVDFQANGLSIIGQNVLDGNSLSRAVRHEQDCVIGVLDDRIVHIAIGREGQVN